MKKNTKTKRVKKTVKSQHTGLALLLCFLVAGVAVAISLRQIALERRLTKNAVDLSSVSKVAGVYTVTTNVGKLTNRTITMTFTPDRNVKLVSKIQGEDKVQELSGNWSGDSNGTIITSFKDRVYAFSYIPDGKGTLRLLNPDVELWGAATLTLTRE
ncbi:MAG: hypothetical protein DPW11_04535 [bacterium]|nr:hypothetical protein [Candidatus Microgenomates bacterium CPR3]MCQ3945011.1 hypothetical protein [bacterium]RIK50991.1 MAG: hypothetical protein DCC61_03980 [Candidatus Microgenomates bacterium]